MSAPQLKNLLSELRDGPVALSSAAEVAVRRDRLLPAVRASVRAVPQRRRARRTRRITATLALAACGVLGLGLSRVIIGSGDAPPATASGGVRIEQAGGEAPRLRTTDGRQVRLGPSATVAAHGVVSIPQASRASLTTAQGVAVELSEGTRADLGGLEQVQGRSRLRLLEGRAHFKVPPLGSGAQFAVVTPDAEVTVHGTEFEVGLRAGTTCVRVREGRVSVRRGSEHRFLGPGESSGCREPATARAVEDRRAAAPDAEPERRRPERPRNPRPAEPVSGTLAEETRLLSAALSAERRGDKAGARRIYGQLLEQYPSSPLAPEARSALGRLK